MLRELFLSDASRAEALPIVEKAIEALKEAGATLVDPVFSGVNLVEMVKRKNSATNYFEYWPARDAYFATWPGHAPFHSVNRLIELLGRENVKGVGNLSQPLPDESDEYLAHHRTQEMMRNALIRLIDTLELDALIYPFSLKGPRKWDNRSLRGMEETALAASYSLACDCCTCRLHFRRSADRFRVYWQAIQRFNATSGSSSLRESLSCPSRTELDPVVSKN